MELLNNLKHFYKQIKKPVDCVSVWGWY